MNQFFIIARTPIRDLYGVADLCEVQLEGSSGESQAALVQRWKDQRQKAHEPAPVVKPEAPKIAEILPDPGQPTYPKINAEVILEAENNLCLTDNRLFMPGLHSLGAAPALAGLFLPNECIGLSAPHGELVDTFESVRDRVGGFEKIIVNPLVAKRFQAVACRSNVIVSFPGISLEKQFARAYFLSQRHFSPNLAIWIPSELVVHFCFSVRDRSTKAVSDLAREAIELAADPKAFNPRFASRVPGSLDRNPIPAAQRELAKVGLEHCWNQCVTLFRPQEGDAPPTRGEIGVEPHRTAPMTVREDASATRKTAPKKRNSEPLQMPLGSPIQQERYLRASSA